MRRLARYELAGQADQRFGTLSGGQQARLQVLLLELLGRHAAAARRAHRQPRPRLGRGAGARRWTAFEGTVIAVTHDRWFTRGFDRFVVFAGDGEVRETPEPLWE